MLHHQRKQDDQDLSNVNTNKAGSDLFISTNTYTKKHVQYWCIDSKYRIYVARLSNGGKMSFSKSFHPFRAEPHKFYIYHRYTNIVFILQ